MKKKNTLISIIITNFNKEKYLNKSLNSVINQNYKNLEIILFDDVSTDNSIKIIKKFKNIVLIKNNRKKFNSGPLNQINGILQAFKKSNGKIICLLDSDDQFSINKLKEINKFFINNPNKNFLINLPFDNYNFRLNRTKANFNIWPSIFPTSCLSFKRNFFNLFLKNNNLKLFPNLEIDARLSIFSYYFCNDYNILYKRLTKYVKSDHSISSNYKKFSINWWNKRKEAFDFLKVTLKNKKIYFVKSYDYYLTNLIYFFIKKKFDKNG